MKSAQEIMNIIETQLNDSIKKEKEIDSKKKKLMKLIDSENGTTGMLETYQYLVKQLVEERKKIKVIEGIKASILGA